MSTEIDKIVLELLRREIPDEETYKLAEQLYQAYKQGGQKKVRDLVYGLLREIGIEIGEE